MNEIRSTGLSTSSGTRFRSSRRRGAVVIILIAVMAVVAVVMVSLVRLAAAEQKELQTQTRQLQARWLAESALERAASRLAADANYRGETWTVPAEAIGARDGATIKIEIQEVPETSTRRLVRVQADYPDHPQLRVRRTRQAIVEVPREGAKP